jgi:endonuclease YncB( thermonuclease family)
MKLLILYLLSVLLSTAQLSAIAEIINGKVVGVADGDTVTVLDSAKVQYKIRLTGIDAPEKAQPYGQVSKKSLSDLVFNKDVEISWEKRDRYQRILGKVLLDKQDICLEQVKRGMAWHYKQYQSDQSQEDRTLYDLAEKKAREAKLGLWADDSPVEPSQFRRKR